MSENLSTDALQNRDVKVCATLLQVEPTVPFARQIIEIVDGCPGKNYADVCREWLKQRLSAFDAMGV